MNPGAGASHRLGARASRTLLAVSIGAILLVAGAGVAEWTLVSAGRTVIVSDVLGVTLTYALGTPHDAGNPVCTNCPVQGHPGERIVLTVWIDWTCRVGTTCTAWVTVVTIEAPFRLVGTSPALPMPLRANMTAHAEPGNGTWASGWTIFALDLAAPETAGTYTLTGELTVGLAR